MKNPKMLSSADIANILNAIPVGAKKASDHFFNAANLALLGNYKKLGVITIKEFDAENAPSAAVQPISETLNEIYCNAFGCKQVFQNVATYQAHFNSLHRFICAQCKRSMPTAHLLDLHISEQHDAYFAARVERGDVVFACLLEECKIMFKCHEERKEHCIKAHKFPANYRYFQQQHKPEAKSKSLREEAMTTASSEAAEYVDVQTDLAETVNTQTAKKTKPFSFTFGHATNKTFIKPNKHAKDSTSCVDLQDLKMALDET